MSLPMYGIHLAVELYFCRGVALVSNLQDVRNIVRKETVSLLPMDATLTNTA